MNNQKPPRKVSLAGFDPDVRKALNDLIDYVAANTVRPTPGVRIERTRQGTFLRVEGGKGGTTVTDDTYY